MVAYNIRPQQSTCVAPLDFLIPERVRNIASDRLPETPYPKELARYVRKIQEARRAHLCDLTFTVRRSLTRAQRRYQKRYEERVNTVNKTLRPRNWVYIETLEDQSRKMDPRMEGPSRILRRDRHTLLVLVKGNPDRVISDHVARAPTPACEMDSTTTLHSPQKTVVPLDHEETEI